MSLEARRHALKSMLAFALVAAGCGGPQTSVTQLWRAEVVVPAIRSFIVFGASMDEANRRVVEDTIVGALRERSLNARPSYDLFPGPLPDREQARQAVQASGVEGVIVATLKNVREQKVYVPGGTGLWYGYYGGAAWGYWDPGYVASDNIVNFETTLWDARPEGGKLLWAASTETTNPAAGREFANSLTKTIMKSLEQQGFVPPKPGG